MITNRLLTMTTLTKEEVINNLQAALEQQTGKPVSIEQAGSWYKIDGAKSVRFGELESMLADLTSSAPSKPVKKEAVKAPKKAVVKKQSAPVSSNDIGMTPKQMWRAKLAKSTGKQTLPRGF